MSREIYNKSTDTQKHKILNLLMDGKYHSPNHITAHLHIYQYGARVKELREIGFDIENVKFKNLSCFDRDYLRSGINYTPLPNHTFFRLVTPLSCIDFEKLEVTTGKVEQKELFS